MHNYEPLIIKSLKTWKQPGKMRKMHSSEIGHIASQMWFEMPFQFPFIDLDAFVVMPNHIHGIIVINLFIGTLLAGLLKKSFVCLSVNLSALRG